MAIFDWFSHRVFNAVHRNNLVYNTCWEDPRLDRVAMNLSADDTVMVITSAGCNTLDYALCQPKTVHAVDMNPRQNALLQLKIAGIRHLQYDDFFRMFGQGHWPGVRKAYEQKLRGDLCVWSQSFWDKKLKFFENPKRSFYYRGTSGAFARMVRVYMERVIKVRPEIDALLAAKTIEEQREIYENRLKQKFWTGLVKFTMRRDTTMSMMGVPKAQRRQIEMQYEGGLVKYLQDAAQAVFAELPFHDNYFWRVYLNGRYTQECCPEYLKPDNFAALKNGLVDRVSVHTDSVQGFLEKHDQPITRFVLLDHMDWLSDKMFPLLESEWQAIINRASPQARILWRSGGLKTEYINDVKVRKQGKIVPINDLLSYDSQLASELHDKDRVHTYASFYIADVSA